MKCYWFPEEKIVGRFHDVLIFSAAFSVVWLTATSVGAFSLVPRYNIHILFIHWAVDATDSDPGELPIYGTIAI
jgi:hypothetical protein